MLLGEERAFLPVKHLLGNGALTLDDIDVLKGGCLALLPTDTKERTALCVDSPCQALLLMGKICLRLEAISTR
jgi:hypothetical protein